MGTGGWILQKSQTRIAIEAIIWKWWIQKTIRCVNLVKRGAEQKTETVRTSRIGANEISSFR